MPAARTGLRGIGGIDTDYLLLMHGRFIHQFLLEIIEGPGYGYIAVFLFYSLCSPADAGQILKNKQRVCLVLLDECLTDAVIYITHPTVFSPADGLQPSSRGRGPDLLQFFPKGGIVRPLCLDSSSRKEGCLSL